MTTRFNASVWKEGEQYVAQCLGVDISSQGTTEAEAPANLRDAIALHFEPPVATLLPETRPLEVELR